MWMFVERGMLIVRGSVYSRRGEDRGWKFGVFC